MKWVGMRNIFLFVLLLLLLFFLTWPNVFCSGSHRKENLATLKNETPQRRVSERVTLLVLVHVLVHVLTAVTST